MSEPEESPQSTNRGPQPEADETPQSTNQGSQPEADELHRLAQSGSELEFDAEKQRNLANAIFSVVEDFWTNLPESKAHRTNAENSQKAGLNLSSICRIIVKIGNTMYHTMIEMKYNAVQSSL